MGVSGGELKSPPDIIYVGVFRGCPPKSRGLERGFGGGPFPGAWGQRPRNNLYSLLTTPHFFRNGKMANA
jgi:hypothetical protein